MSTIKSDSQGFLVGERIHTPSQPGAVSGMSVLYSMRNDVGVIRRLLEASAGRRFRVPPPHAVSAQGRSSAADAVSMARRYGAGGHVQPTGQTSRRAAVSAAARGTRERDSLGRFVGSGQATVVGPAPRGATALPVPASTTAAAGQGVGGAAGDRDSKGRFSGAGRESSDFAGGDGVLGKIASTLDGIGDAVGRADQIDPTLAALKEVRDVVSPLGRGVVSLGQRMAERKKERWYDRILKAIKGKSGATDDDGGSTGSRVGGFFGAAGGMAGNAMGFLGTLLTRVFAPVAAAWAAWEVGQWLGKKIYDWLSESGLMTKIFDAFDAVKRWGADKLNAAGSAVEKVKAGVSSGYQGARLGGLDSEVLRESRMRTKSPQTVAEKAGYAAGKAANGVEALGAGAGSVVGGIRRLIGVEGTKRIYEKDDGSTETRTGGTVSWRNNNPGNLKFGYAGSADKTDTSKRTKEQALASAQKRYEGVVDLDQFGNAIFATEAHGRAAKSSLLRGTHGGRTVEEMLPKYAIDDYSGKANHAAYAASIYKTADARGVNLRGKKISDMSQDEMGALLDGMKKTEGFRPGTVSVAGSVAPDIRPAAAATVATDSFIPMRSASVPMPVPDRMPTFQVPKIPERLNTGGQAPASVVIRGDVGQDVSDRTIAHVVTGGLGGAKH